MTRIDSGEIKKLKENFNTVWKRIEPYESRRPLPKEESKITEYRADIVDKYNDLLSYITDGYSELSEVQKETLDKVIKTSLLKLKRAFEILKVKYKFTEDIFVQINANEISYESVLYASEKTATVSNTSASTSTQRAHESDTDIDEAIDNSFNGNTTRESENSSDSDDSDNDETMPQTKESFLKFAASIVNYKYGGEPAKREGFIADIVLIEGVAEQDQKGTCFDFVKTRMEGKALESVPDEARTVKDIIDALRKDIKNEPSEVIESRFAALRLDKGNYAKFTELTEKQAEAYRRSLVNEGISKTKAQQMAVKRTVELCRKTARSEIVKAVLSSSKFETPAEVLAKFVTENDLAWKEKKEADRSKQGKGSRNDGNKNKNDNKNGNKNNSKFNKNNGNSNGNFNKGNFKNGKSGNFKGNRNNRNGEATIRFVQGNGAGPSGSGEQAQGQEQVFHFPVN